LLTTQTVGEQTGSREGGQNGVTTQVSLPLTDSQRDVKQGSAEIQPSEI
jgi:hypothetical protein